jgi:glutaminyl-tRNA synthetase
LRNAFIIRCDDVIRAEDGSVRELHCSFDPDSKSGLPGASRKVKGTIHWVSAEHGVRAEVRLYDRLFSVPNPLADKSRDFLSFLNPESLRIIQDAVVEPSIAEGVAGEHFQFERLGYFYHDPDSGKSGHPVLNRTVTLRDTWARLQET